MFNSEEFSTWSQTWKLQKQIVTRHTIITTISWQAMKRTHCGFSPNLDVWYCKENWSSSCFSTPFSEELLWVELIWVFSLIVGSWWLINSQKRGKLSVREKTIRQTRMCVGLGGAIDLWQIAMYLSTLIATTIYWDAVVNICLNGCQKWGYNTLNC